MDIVYSYKSKWKPKGIYIRTKLERKKNGRFLNNDYCNLRKYTISTCIIDYEVKNNRYSICLAASYRNSRMDTLNNMRLESCKMLIVQLM